MEWVAAVSGALVEVTIFNEDDVLMPWLRHDPWWSWILTFGRQRRKWHEPCRILPCLEPSAW